MMHNSFQALIPYFPAQIQTALSRIPAEQAAEIQEIRLRISRQLHLVTRGRELVLTQQGTLAAEPAAGFTVSAAMLETVFRNVCAHSVHSCTHTLRQGFVTAAGGSRVGIVGTAVMQNQTPENLRAVSGMNFRVASERIGCADSLLSRLGLPGRTDGILIAGPPASGKTTLLRDLARTLGSIRRVCILDERGELAAVRNGVPQFDVGLQTDVLDGYPKGMGIEIAVRVMSPQVLICDEIGTEAEAEALLASLHTGVQLIASAHAGNIAALTARPQIRRLIQAGVFRRAVLLGTDSACGQVLAAESFGGGAA